MRRHKCGDLFHGAEVGMKERVQRLFAHSKRAASLAVGTLVLASSAAAQIVAGGKNDPMKIITGGFCGNGKLLEMLTNPVVLSIMAVLAGISYGFQTSIGKRDATLALTSTGIGVIVIAAAVTIVSLFVKVC
jgi:hypothetical protein